MTKNSYFILFLLLSLLFSAKANSQQTRFYTIASISNVRENPDSTSKVNVKLLINSSVLATKESDGWVYIRETFRDLGWIHKSLLSKKKVTIEKLRTQLNSISENDFDMRIRLLERAAALKPTNIEVLSELAEIFTSSGNKEKEQEVREFIKSLSDPDIIFSPKDDRIVFIYNRGQIHPLLNSSSGRLKKIYKNEYEADKFVLQYFSPGRKLLLSDNNGKSVGTIRVENGSKPGFLGLSVCSEGLIATTKPIGILQEKVNIAGFATTFNIKETIHNNNFNLNEEHKKKLNSLAIDTYRQTKHRTGSGERRLDSPESSIKFVGYISGDFNGDKITDIVSAHTMDEAKYSTSYYVLLVSNVTKDTDFKRIWSITQGGSESTKADISKFHGKIDINGDGIDEFIFETSHYEWQEYHVVSSKNKKWNDISFYAGGC